jgi:5-(carboxyamino)imidazole ribonucleotide synthase
VTTEFENVPAQALQRLADGGARVAPGAAAVRVCQDRALEKQQFERCGVPCAPWCRVETEADVDSVAAALFPALLKTARLGYDGKGQCAVASRAQLRDAWRAFGEVPCVLERRLALSRELSAIVARGFDGRAVHLPLQHNLHRGGILAVTQVPAPAVGDALARRAFEHAATLAAAMDYVGVLCVEFFVLDDGSLAANEMAPRPHNSGHWSIDGCDLSQFELQVRSMVRWPLAAPRQHSAAVMLNLLGDLWHRGGRVEEPDWPAVLALPGAHLHRYGKAEPRPGRKMGHLTFTAGDLAAARAQALQAAAVLGIDPF